MKLPFEAEIFLRGSQVRINLIDVGNNEIFKLLAETLKKNAKMVIAPGPQAVQREPAMAAGLQ